MTAKFEPTDKTGFYIISLLNMQPDQRAYLTTQRAPVFIDGVSIEPHDLRADLNKIFSQHYLSN